MRKVSDSYVQLEHPAMYALTSDEVFIAALGGEVTMDQTKLAFKTIALYHRRREVIVPHEVEKLLPNDSVIDNCGYRLKTFSLIENAVIAAFSMETYRRALLRTDCSFQANGLKLEIFMSLDNEPNVWLSDEYGIDHQIAVYFYERSDSMNSVTQTKDVFESLYSIDALECCKRM